MIAILLLKAGEIRVQDREPITTGILKNSLWNEDNPKFEIGSNLYFINYCYPPQISGISYSYNINSGKVTIKEYSEVLLTGSFDLIAKNASSDSISITDLFRATRVEDQDFYNIRN